MANPLPGQTYTVSLAFYNEENGLPVDPSSVQLDFTTGGLVGQVPDINGPFFYSPGNTVTGNDFEGGTNGTAITTGNSGTENGLPESAFSAVTLLGTGTAVYSTAEHAYYGTTSALVTALASGDAARLTYNTTVTALTQYFRLYMYLTSRSTTNTKVLDIRDASDNAEAQVYVTAAGNVAMSDSRNGTPLVITSVNEVPLNTWCRISGFVTVSATAGQVGFTLNYTDTESSIPDETQTSAATLNTGTAAPGMFQFGMVNSFGVAYSLYVDNIACASTVPLGAYSAGGAQSSTSVYRTGIGTYALDWIIPYNIDSGAYTANWSVFYLGDTYLITENFYVGGAASGYVPPPPGLAGYWTGSVSYTPTYTTMPNTVTFGESDANGVQWYWLSLTGWDGADISGQVVQRASDHGGWPTQQFYAPRSLTWNVLAIAPDQASRDVARAQLQSAISVSNLSTFTYNEPVPKQAMLRRSGRIVETYATTNEVAFAIPLICPDPRKYGTTLKSATATFADNTNPVGVTVPFTVPWTSPAQPPQGSVTVTNAGNFETRPVITVTGPVIAPALIDFTSGQQVTWQGLNMAATDVLVVDFDQRQAILNGNALRPADFTSAWWVMEPGDTEIILGGQTTGGSTVTVTWRDAWI